MNLSSINLTKPQKHALVGLGALAALSTGYLAYRSMSQSAQPEHDNRVPHACGLDQKTAGLRRERINGVVNYDVYLILKEGKKFQGSTRIEFDKVDEDGDLWLDFTGDILR